MLSGIDKGSGKRKCRYDGCIRNPLYISKNGKIIKDTICAWISVNDAGGWAQGYYCRDCIDKVFEDLKKTFDSRLWVFQ